MKVHPAILFVILTAWAASNAMAQNLDVNQLSNAVPQGWESGNYSFGLPKFGYQFRYGSFTVQPGASPTVHAMFVLATQQFPQGSVEKLYHEELTYVGFNPGGPFQGAVFQCTVNGATRYFLFGTNNQGTQDGVPLRRLRYFNQSGNQTYDTLTRFYSP